MAMKIQVMVFWVVTLDDHGAFIFRRQHGPQKHSYPTMKCHNPQDHDLDHIDLLLSILFLVSSSTINISTKVDHLLLSIILLQLPISVQPHTHTHTHTHIYIYIYIYEQFKYKPDFLSEPQKFRCQSELFYWLIGTDYP
jgi:hypothetical protein